MSARILLVDDEPRVTDALRRALRLEEYEVSVCNSAKGALAMMETETFDVIVSDEQMPGMTGTALLAIVRDRWPDTVRIVLTGQANLEAALRAINEGSVFRFLTKPCRGGDLAGTVRQALQHKRLLAQSSRMLRIIEYQEAIIAQMNGEADNADELLEKQNAIEIECTPGDVESLLDEIQRGVTRAERRFGRKAS